MSYIQAPERVEPTHKTVGASWALFLGVGLLMIGNGLQGSLLGVRASLEGFATTVTGVVMAGYYLGFLFGSVVTPRWLTRVGHIRVFAALASSASTAVLLHSLFVRPATWMGMRIVTGFCMAGLYVVAESWLNDRATNETRGTLLSIYMVVVMGGLATGQLFLNAADPAGFELFILASVLVSVALVPLALSTSRVPSFVVPTSIRLTTLFRKVPLGVVGSLGVGIANGAVFGMGAVYATGAGMSVPRTSLFMSMAMVGAVALQLPIGRLSDSLPRRNVIGAVTTLAAVAAAGAALAGPQGWPVLALMFVYGGLSFPLYSLCVAHTNDALTPHESVAAAAALVFTTGIGAIIGPVLVAVAMASTGPAAFFWTLVVVHLVIAGFAAYRIGKRRAMAQRHGYRPLAARGSAVIAAGGDHTN